MADFDFADDFANDLMRRIRDAGNLAMAAVVRQALESERSFIVEKEAGDAAQG